MGTGLLVTETVEPEDLTTFINEVGEDSIFSFAEAFRELGQVLLALDGFQRISLDLTCHPESLEMVSGVHVRQLRIKMGALIRLSELVVILKCSIYLKKR